MCVFLDLLAGKLSINHPAYYGFFEGREEKALVFNAFPHSHVCVPITLVLLLMDKCNWGAVPFHFFKKQVLAGMILKNSSLKL